MSAQTFQQAIQEQPVNVVQAALCFAREIAYPHLDIAEYTARVEELIEEASASIPRKHKLAERAELLADILFFQHRYRGNVSQYEDPDNSYLNRVIDRRLGIPISLSVIYIAAAKGIGIPAEGVGLPGHFIVGIRDGETRIFIDPFNGGTRLSMPDCAQLVQQATGYSGPFQEEWLKPASPQMILTRMLNNLRNIYLNQEDGPHALRVVERLRMLQPQHHELLRDLGMIHQRNGSLRLAVQNYEAYLRQSPGAPDAGEVMALLRAATQQIGRLN